LLQFLSVGAVVVQQRVLFFHAIKISTVSVTLFTLSATSVITSILEVVINKQKISLEDVAVGLVIVFGIYLIFKFEVQYVLGIICGLSCALCASVFSILNARMVKHTSPTVITFYEMLGAFLWVSVMMLVSGDFNGEMW